MDYVGLLNTRRCFRGGSNGRKQITSKFSSVESNVCFSDAGNNNPTTSNVSVAGATIGITFLDLETIGADKFILGLTMLDEVLDVLFFDMACLAVNSLAVR